ncbi:LOW QUALITY PROTEIN: hypothetical protein QYF61_027780 [Mycteria americana]|uniref:Uncharacterized protein n=1 Tax=Mycteria americana TaxID=33587 RepID=A0AAN7P6I2_MYCAM|nr:LOW QUALITY PROTEIN: hypothetical protein QYF61_027780 [Mycteria americana]
MFLLLLLLNVFQVLFKRSTLRLDSYEWQGAWDSMGKYLGEWAPPTFRNFTPEQVQNPEKLVKYLEKVCCHPGNSRETQITAMCWGLAHAYRALFNTIQYPQGEEKVSGSDNKTAGTAATPTLAAGNVAEPEKQPVLVSVAPIHKKKSWKDDEKAGPSREEEELVNETVTTRSLSLSELRDMQKDFSHRPGEHVVIWLLQCWDNRASSLELEGREAKQLGSLPREGGIDRAIGQGPQSSASGGDSCQERYPFKEDVIYHPGNWATIERGIQYLRELAMLEVIYGDLDSEQLSKSPVHTTCVAEVAVEKLSQEVQQLKEDRSYSPPVQTSILAIRSKHSSAQERG